MNDNDLKNLIFATKNTERVSGLTHNFYKYPARFSPLFASEVIKLFTEPGDLVLDPFVGGGTTLVEATSLGRRCIGVDISSLSVFISKVKTTPLNDDEITKAKRWTDQIPNIKLLSREKIDTFWIENGYIKNLSDKSTWRIKKLINLFIVDIEKFDSQNLKDFLRCSLLKTGQWAIDARKYLPSVNDFRSKLSENVLQMIEQLNSYSNSIHNPYSFFEDEFSHILNRSVIGIETEPIFSNISPKLILMSPPYPGVHVLYHRWQVNSRKETAAPFWIANKLDGNGESYYTMGNRQTHTKYEYFHEMQNVFNSLARISNKDTILVQMIAFTDPINQLPRYLNLMKKSGFTEIFLNSNKTRKRIWRNVPNRKWYTEFQVRQNSSKEVVLIHKRNS